MANVIIVPKHLSVSHVAFLHYPSGGDSKHLLFDCLPFLFNDAKRGKIG